jgi:hypothetical protein
MKTMAFAKKNQEEATQHGSMDDDLLQVITVVDQGEGKKAYWQRVGTAFRNKDRSLNIRLNALPVNGTLHIRPIDKTV